MYCISCAQLLIEKEKITREEFEALFTEKNASGKMQKFFVQMNALKYAKKNWWKITLCTLFRGLHGIYNTVKTPQYII